MKHLTKTPHHPARTRFFTKRVGIHYVQVMTNTRVFYQMNKKPWRSSRFFSKYLPTDTVHIHRKGQRCPEPPKKVYFHVFSTLQIGPFFSSLQDAQQKKTGDLGIRSGFFPVLLYVNRMKFDRKKRRCNFWSFFFGFSTEIHINSFETGFIQPNFQLH